MGGSAVRADPDRPRQVRRSFLLLAAAQAVLLGAVGAYAAFGPLAVADLTGRRSGAAVLFGLYYLAAAVGAVSAGRLMDRAGRRPGLAAGYVLVMASGGLLFLAVSSGAYPLLLTSNMVLGAGVGAALLGRGAVADMYPPERRGRAVGLLVLAGTAGAIGGPFVGNGLHDAALGAEAPLAAPFLAVLVFGLLALGLVMALRPDPRDLAVEGPGGPRRRPAEVLRARPAVVAIVTIGVVQAMMVTFMSVIPVAVHQHGAGELTVSLIVSLHLGAMFAPSPFFGILLDRVGRRSGLMAGVVVTAVGVVLASAVTGAVPQGIGLVLIGAGWSAAYVGSTAVVSDLAAPAERGGTLGLLDLTAAVAAGTGVLASAGVLELIELRGLGVVALLLLALPLILLVRLSEAAPGRWEEEPEAAPVAVPPV